MKRILLMILCASPAGTMMAQTPPPKEQPSKAEVHKFKPPVIRKDVPPPPPAEQAPKAEVYKFKPPVIKKDIPPPPPPVESRPVRKSDDKLQPAEPAASRVVTPDTPPAPAEKA